VILNESYTGNLKAAKFSLSHDHERMERYVILDKDVPVPSAMMDYNEYHSKYNGHPQFILLPDNDIEYLTELCHIANRTPSMIDFLSEDVVSAFAACRFPDRAKHSAYYDRYSLKTIIHQLKPESISKLVIATGLFHSTGIWKENQESLYLNGKIAIQDLLVFREDIYDIIYAATRSFSHSGSGLELKVMENVRKGRYALKGMPDNEEKLLENIGISKLHIEIMKNAYYMFPKAHCISELRIELKLIWFWLNYPELYEGINLLH